MTNYRVLVNGETIFEGTRSESLDFYFDFFKKNNNSPSTDLIEVYEGEKCIVFMDYVYLRKFWKKHNC